MAMDDLTVPEQDVLMDWSNNAEGDLRHLLEDAQRREGKGYERLLLNLHTEDPSLSLTAWLQREVPRYFAWRNGGER